MGCMLLTLENSSAHALVVWHLLLPLMNSFNKTDAAIFMYRLRFHGAFPFLSLQKE